MTTRAIFEGEQDQLQDFLDVFYDTQGETAPRIDEGINVVLTVQEDKHKQQFQNWAYSFGLKCTFIKTPR